MDLDGILWLYSLLLRLFPARFRDEFGDEMSAVFAEAVAAPPIDGGPSPWRLLLRELRDLPPLALQEQLVERKRPRYISSLHPAQKAPRGSWALPLAGFGAAAVTLLLINRLLDAGLGLRLDALIHRIDGGADFSTALFRRFIDAGLFWIMVGLVCAALLTLLRVVPHFRPLYRRITADWTYLSFIFYGAALWIVMIDFDGYRHETLWRLAIYTLLAAGGFGFLRFGSRSGRFAALFSAATLAMFVMAVGKYHLTPLQDWPELTTPDGIDIRRRVEALGALVAWFWIVTAMLVPWIIRRRPPLIVNLTLVGLWLVLFHPILPYLQVIFTRQEFRLNQIALIGVIGLLIYQSRSGGLRFRFGSPPALHVPAAAMLLAASAAFILAERLVDINTLSASLFGLAFYGLLGLWLEPRVWRGGMPASLLLIATLPFGEHLQTFIGYPVRLATARLVQDGLAAFGVASVGIDTILVFENGISQIDLPCSGVKSLWTGGMFFLAAAWIERRRFHNSWAWVGLIFIALLLTANLARVAVLVTVGQVLGWRLFAEMLHVPLGVLGFAAACAALVWMLRRFVPAAEARGAIAQPDPLRPRWLAPALLMAILALALLYAPRPSSAAAQSSAEMRFPDEINAQPWEFSPGEIDWLSADGPLSAGRWRFEWRGRGGSLLLISGNSWRAHHRPERCFEAYGLTVDRSITHLLPGDVPLRLVSLSAPRKADRYSAVYWLQSKDRVTDDYAARIWSDLSPQREVWMLVTILFDDPADPLTGSLEELYALLRQSVDRNLKGGE